MKTISAETTLKYFQDYKICRYRTNKQLKPSNKLQKYQPNKNNNNHKVGASYLKILHQRINKLSKSVYAPTTTLKKENKFL